jgi:hypothetical protein
MIDIATTTGLVIARAIIAHAQDGAFGVLVRDMPEFDPQSLLEGLAERQGDIRFRIAMPGYSLQEGKQLKNKAGALGFSQETFVTTVEGAERWRNDVDVKDTIVVVTPREIAKLNSLNRFTTLRSDELYDQVCEEGRAKLGVNDAQRQLWKALDSKRVRRAVPLEGLLAYFAELQGCNEQQIPERSRDVLYLLGLLPDPALFRNPTSARIAARLEDNQKTVDQLEMLTRADRQRISKALASKAETKVGGQLRAIYLKVMAFYREQSPEKLRELTLDDAHRLLRTKSQDGKGDDTESNSEQKNGDTPEARPTHNPTVRAMDLILQDDEEALAALADVIQEAIGSEEEDEEIEAKDPETGVVLDVKKRHPFLRIIERFITATGWGARLDLGANVLSLDEAIAQLDKAEAQVFDPCGKEWDLRGVLGGLVQDGHLEFPILESFDEFVGMRSQLVPHLRGLVLQPLVQLNARADLLERAQRYLTAYESLTEGLKRSYEAIADVAPDGVQILVSRVLALDTIILKTGESFKAILSPLHPLHLWKYIELSRQLRVQAGSISDTEKELLRSRVDELPNFVTTLYVSAYMTKAGHKVLPEAGVRDGIPYYEELAHQYAGRDGVHEIARLLDKFCVLHPHARFGLRVAFIDPPDVEFVLKEIVRLASGSGLDVDAVHVRLFFTQRPNPAVGALGGGAEDEEGAERYRGISSSSQFTLEVCDELLKLEQVAEKLREHPAHVAVLFDPSNAKTLRFARSPSLVVHPICLPMQFSYDKITRSVKVIPASDGGVFADHNDLRNRLSNLLTGSFFGVAAELKAEEQQLQKLTKGCAWLVVADRAQEGALSIGVPRISLKRTGKRDVSVYAQDKNKFVAEFDRQLRKCNYTPTRPAVERLIDDLGGLLTDGLLGLVSQSGGTTLDERRTQGLVGTLVTSSWYRRQHPESLLVSIDSPEAKRWLELRDDGSRADLFGVVDDGDGCTIDILEVKTYAQPEDAYRVAGGEISGDAVDQLLNTARIIEEIFQLDPNTQRLVGPQRREVLRQHLFRECFLEDRTDTEKQYWSKRLNEVFALQTKVRLRLSLAVVGLTQSRASSVRVLKSNGRDVRLIELTEDEVRRYVTDHVQPLGPSKSKPAGNGGSSGSAPPQAPQGALAETRTEDISSQESRTAILDAAVDPIAMGRDATREEPPTVGNDPDEQQLIVQQGDRLRKILRDYGVQVQDLDPHKAQVGPSVIRYRVRLRAGSPVSKLRSRAEDIGRELAAKTTPFIDNIAGENFVGIDLERPRRQFMPLQVAIDELDGPAGLQLPIAVGVTPGAEHVNLDIVQLPHLLVAGSTGSGKTVFLHAVLLSLISKLPPSRLELLIIDPKATDFVLYNGLPYLRGGRVITEAEDAIAELERLTNEELRERTRTLQQARVPNISEFNASNSLTPLKPIVVVIDEYADLMAVLSKKDRQDFEREINRLAQRARSVGIHLVLATQRPTADIVTGLLKANMPCRISFRLPSRVDSQTILDQTGAENLLGKGDMLLLMNDRLVRLQGYYMSPAEMSERLSKRFPGSGFAEEPQPEEEEELDLSVDDSGKANQEDLVGEVTGLTIGADLESLDSGDVLTIEVAPKHGEGAEVIGGSGDVLKQSVLAAWRYVQQSARVYGINQADVDENGVSVHLVNIAEYREGPSAGIPFVVAMVSALTGRAVRKRLALTGEVSLKGKVSGVGGVPQKIVAAYKSGRRLVIIPEANLSDLQYVPRQVLDNMEVRGVSTAEEAVDAALTH